MEADIIVAGFRKSLSDHGLIYKYVVGDADSSVFFKIKSTIHYPGGIEVQKIDCVNHGLRCLNTKLHGISKMTTLDKRERDIVKSRVPQMSRDAKGAICHNSEKFRSGDTNAKKALYDDLINIPRHVFGDHMRCKEYFCKKIGTRENHSLGGKVFYMVNNSFNQMAQRSDRLIHNVTSNLAEGFMGQMAKFTSGKRCNQLQRYGYTLRSISAVFAYDYGRFWPAAVYKNFYDITNSSWSKKYAQSLEYRKRAKRPGHTKFMKKSQKLPTPKREDYGDLAVDVDIDPIILKDSIERLASDLQVSPEERTRILHATVGQAFNDEWKYQRRHRITASKAPNIFKMRDSTNSTSCIKSILYPLDLTKNENVKRGIDMEPLAKRKYEEETGNIVTECGLFIYAENGILAASPDGLVGSNGIIEIKCPAVRPLELCTRKDKILVQDSNANFQLNRCHSYYYQVIMQMYVAEKDFCDFTLYFMDKETMQEEIWIETIHKSQDTDILWGEMVVKLIRFFYEDLAPEIVCPRFTHKLPIRQPEYRRIKKAAKPIQNKGTNRKRPRMENE